MQTELDLDVDASTSKSNLMQARIAAVESIADSIRSQHQHWLSPMLTKLYPNLDGLLLFGSRVNGSATEDSDFDMFVITERYHPGLHDWWLVDGRRVDIHVASLRSLMRSINTERVDRNCFHIKTLSEGVIICGNDDTQNIQRVARSIYISPGDFNGWAKVKLNLMSKLRRARLRAGPFRSIYYTELMQMILEVMSLHQFGWLCRGDVLVEWLSATVPDRMKRLLDCYAMALNGQPEELLKVCGDIADHVCPWVHHQGSYSVTPDGAVRAL